MECVDTTSMNLPGFYLYRFQKKWFENPGRDNNHNAATKLKRSKNTSCQRTNNVLPTEEQQEVKRLEVALAQSEKMGQDVVKELRREAHTEMDRRVGVYNVILLSRMTDLR